EVDPDVGRPAGGLAEAAAFGVADARAHPRGSAVDADIEVPSHATVPGASRAGLPRGAGLVNLAAGRGADSGAGCPASPAGIEPGTPASLPRARHCILIVPILWGYKKREGRSE